jgi:predicted RNA-binding protein YlqC (UPF0109 family)
VATSSGGGKGRRGPRRDDGAAAPADAGAPSDDGGRDAGADHDDARREGPAPDLAELIRYLAVNLVDKGDQVHVALVEERAANVYELEVAEDDLGMIIGRGGKTARALRTLVQAVAPKSRKRTMVEILE